jgi:hypothetical protein
MNTHATDLLTVLSDGLSLIWKVAVQMVLSWVLPLGEVVVATKTDPLLAMTVFAGSRSSWCGAEGIGLRSRNKWA